MFTKIIFDSNVQQLRTLIADTDEQAKQLYESERDSTESNSHPKADPIILRGGTS